MHSAKPSRAADVSWAATFHASFLGRSPGWYKVALLAFLLGNPLVLAVAGPVVLGWLMLGQFIFTLAMALKCYPLQPGGLIALEAVLLGLVSPEAVYQELQANLPVLLLLMFMVAGIHFLRELLLFLFTSLLVRVESRIALALLFCLSSAFLSAFLDALTVVAVVITVASGLYAVYNAAASAGSSGEEGKTDFTHADLEHFRGYLRGLLMHAAVGTALGGVATLVGEPQNLLIGNLAGWNFGEFLRQMLPVSAPVLLAGGLTCVFVETMRWFGYGHDLPAAARTAIVAHVAETSRNRTRQETLRLWLQAATALTLLAGLAFHVAEVGLVGLMVIVLATALCGITEEKRIGHAFEEAMPFAALLATFFVIVGVIHQQHLFDPVIAWVLAQDEAARLPLMYAANGLLSAVSDNVFVASVYISNVHEAFTAGNLTREQFDLLAIAINAGTNIPSVATPNGQAAFLLLLTSAIAPAVRLGYGSMLWMALPYTITLTTTGLLAILYLL